MTFVTNQEKLSSSVMQQLMNTLRENPELRAALGEAIRPEPVWWMNGDPWISGAVCISLLMCDGHGAEGLRRFTCQAETLT